jgi:hypothetical protein
LKSKGSVTFQRAKSKWLKEGDSNSAFFHACINHRKASNTILALKIGHSWHHHPSALRHAVFMYFYKLFSYVHWDMPNLDELEFLSLKGEQNESLVENFREKENFEVIRSSKGNKSPGPVGFSFKFF